MSLIRLIVALLCVVFTLGACTSGEVSTRDEALVFTPVPPTSCPLMASYAASPPTLYATLSATTILPPGVVSDCPNSQCADHEVYVPNAAATWHEPLVVFLPGTSMEPDKHDLVLQMAAYAGYRTIGLSYSNTTAVTALCSGAACTAGCFGDKRQEIIDGTVPPAAVRHVENGDTILYRLLSALTELDAQHPTDGWDAYFTAPAAGVPPTMANIQWCKIILAGFSQGAGHALKIAHDHEAQGVVVFDGGDDQCVDLAGNTVVADWYTAGTNLSASRPHYAVVHLHGAASFTTPAGLAAWGFSNATNLDAPSATFPGPRLPPLLFPTPLAYTAQTPASACPGFLGNPEHHCMARDQCMPTDVGSGIEALSPDTVYLASAYLRRFCNARNDLTSCF